ncbi:MAG: hypothetical protein QF415_03050 [Candidatus Undinarchaeales archaeon]|jgi:hypothetical protein|nr:hypothetical protein [Candidatus Undinarchaeales archaeon]MDP7492802.1 hypothetical protein [Candidatus Undinarchaeales archaeon]
MAGISLQFEEGICSVCKKRKQVRIIAHDERIAKLCEVCAQGITVSIADFLKKYGKKPTSPFEVKPADELIKPAALDEGTKKRVEELLKKGGKKKKKKKKKGKGGKG